MNEQPFLSLTHVTKRYGEVEALSDVCLSVQGGEILAVMGGNGSGKSTLLHLMTGLLTPDEGSLALSGTPCRFETPFDAAQQGILAILDTPNLIDTLSVAENIMRDRYPRTKLGLINWRALYRDCQALLDALGVPLYARATTGTLGFRAKRLVELIRAYYADARMVLFDEPDFSDDDPHDAAMLYIFGRIAARGRSVVLTTHRIETVLKRADRVLILADGRVAYCQPCSGLAREAVLRMLTGSAAPDRDIYPKLRTFSRAPVLHLRGLQSQEGLHPLDLSVHQGEILGIWALSAQTRMLLPRALYGLARVTGGQILLHGIPVSIPGPAAAVGFGLGFLSEDRVAYGLESDFPIPPNITLMNLPAIRRFGLLRRGEEARVARTFVRSFNIRTPSLRDKVAHLSTGNQQKVLLSRLLFSHCHILMLEEPTKNIDRPTANEIYNFMNSYAQKGGVLLLATAHLDELIGMCDRILVLREHGDYRLFDRAQFDKSVLFAFASD